MEALIASVDVANKLIPSARAEYVKVLLAQREMKEARMVLIETKPQQLQAIVYDYQTLGSVIKKGPTPIRRKSFV